MKPILPSMHPSFERLERCLMAVCLALLAVACFGPAIAQSAHYHAFADQGAWHGVPHAMDVLTNLPFAAWALAGGLCLLLLPKGAITVAERRMAGLFFAGLMVTAAGSSWYHWHPDDTGLALDRWSMTVAFAGVLGLAAAGRVSQRAGRVLAACVLAGGTAAVAVWWTSGNVLPWAVLQFGGMGLVLWLASLKPLPGALPIRWAGLIVIYAVAKGLELGDHAVHAWTGGWVSGHSLKHVVASLAAWPVVQALLEARLRAYPRASEAQTGPIPRAGRLGVSFSEGS